MLEKKSATNPDPLAKVYTFFSCHSAYDGRPLNCSFRYTVNGLISPATDLENNGSHDHGYSTRNYTFEGKKVRYDADKYPGPLLVVGTTLSTPPSSGALVTHEMPAVSGNIEVESIVTSQIGWVCVDNCYTRTSRRYLDTYKVKVGKLFLLPSSSTGIAYRNDSDDYVLDRGDGPHEFGGHPYLEGYYGKAETIQLLPLIAENYYILKGKKLRINDISLPKGGHFDIKGDWKGAHNTHREGKDVDISRDEIDNKACQVDTDFHLAVDSILPPLRTAQYKAWKGKPTAVLCESGGRKHIDFDLNK